nr:hypothetical protein [Rickettsia endosymbiont of Ceutorhynchus assimilis]
MLQSRERKLPTNSQVVKYNTAGDGNCFFHAVFGDNSSGPYKAERAQDMRMEWHKFLSQFESLDDASMPAPLRDHLNYLFQLYLSCFLFSFFSFSFTAMFVVVIRGGYSCGAF